MKAVPIVLLAALLAALSATPALATTWQETRITGPEAWASTPAVWGDTVYWVDARSRLSGYYEIRAWDPLVGERVVRQVPRSTMIEGLYEDTVMYQKAFADHNELCLWDPVAGERSIASTTSGWYVADIWGDTVVWEDYRSGIGQIYMWDPVNGERPVSPSSYAQRNPSIHGDTIVWDDARYDTEYDHQNRVIVSWEPTNGERILGSGYDPAVWGDRFVFWFSDYEDDEDTIAGPSSGLYEWTSQSGRRRLADDSQLPGHGGLEAWGDLVAFSGGATVACLDASGQVSQVSQTQGSNPAYRVSLHDSSIVWALDGAAYLGTPVPEPSSLLALGGLSLLLGSLRRRKGE